MMDWKATYRQIRALKWLSPGSFLLCAVTFAGVYLALHLAGLRASTSVLCGTFAAEQSEQVRTSFFAVIYILFYMATVIVAPILVIAAGIFQVLIKLRHGRQEGQETGPAASSAEPPA